MSRIQPGGRDCILPRQMRLTDMTLMLEPEAGTAQPETNWRWALLDIVRDLLPCVQAEHAPHGDSAWTSEARLRARRLLQLAFIDSRMPAPATPRPGWNHEDVVRLRHCYRLLQGDNGAYHIDFETVLKALTQALLATYRPVVPVFNLHLGLQPLPLQTAACRALVLATGCVLQGLLERCQASLGAGSCQLTLQRHGRDAAALSIRTAELAALMDTTETQEIIARLVARLGADITYRCDRAAGGVLEIGFARTTRGAAPPAICG